MQKNNFCAATLVYSTVPTSPFCARRLSKCLFSRQIYVHIDICIDNDIYCTSLEAMQSSLVSAALHIAPVKWGRESTADWNHTFGSLALIVLSPLLVLLDWVALEHYGGSLWATATAALEDPEQFLLQHLPCPSAQEVGMYACWLLLQAALYLYLPGPSCVGQRTPGG